MMTQIARLFTVALIAPLASAATPATPPAPAAGLQPTAAVSYIPALEVRLRKINVVRPDLIPYPIAYEVVC
jgi:hypothetical protein